MTGLPYTVSELRSTSGPPAPEPPHRLPHEVSPSLRPDGLVAERPENGLIDYDDPMWGNYQWVAMLDPVELSHHVQVEGPREA